MTDGAQRGLSVFYRCALHAAALVIRPPLCYQRPSRAG